MDKSRKQKGRRIIAYFSMEIGVNPAMPTYSGGLGILAGDTLKAAADLGIPMVGISLLHRKGYFRQKIKEDGVQQEESVFWDPQDFLKKLDVKIRIKIEDRDVVVGVWRLDITGLKDSVLPIYFLDTEFPENSEFDRTLTDHLYGGDQRYRLCQEVILGIGGVRMLRALDYHDIKRFHMNEGHSSLLTLELLDEKAIWNKRESFNEEDMEEVRKVCIFTTHTPVPAGHDQFPKDLSINALGRSDIFDSHKNLTSGDMLNMTHLALSLSDYINGVTKKHKEVSKLMFADYDIDSVTNGVHVATWTSEPIKHLFDKYIPGWKEDVFSLRSALNIPIQFILDAHMQAKKQLLEYVKSSSGIEMDANTFTIGFARRMATYKRGDLIFHNPQRLQDIVSKVGKIQLIYSGKAHPADQGGKDIIKRIFKGMETLKGQVKITYLEDYNMHIGKLLTAGVDVWLNTPQPPLEASGTSGMKAALNGVPSLSILDGWWIEGCIENVTGWSFGDGEESEKSDEERLDFDAESMYYILERTVLPAFYGDKQRYANIMRNSIALNGSFFNTQRMV
ncbi:alpha-glucan family phosphorylase, partial [Elusimicrobiota bacterium]